MHPVISNLLARPLDSRIVRLAKKTGVFYSRYADDLTFSTNKRIFPAEIALEDLGGWKVGKSLLREIMRSGFEVNERKSRMQWRGSRQTVTGLITNNKVNLPSEDYRSSRAMCSSVFNKGSYHLPNSTVDLQNLAILEGRMNFAFQVKRFHAQRTDSEIPSSFLDIREKFLFFKYFCFLDLPLIVCEGKTDSVYLRCAMRTTPAISMLYSAVGPIQFLKYSKSVTEGLRLSGGSGPIKVFLSKYKKDVSRYKFRKNQPVIILIDNDDGATDIIKCVKSDLAPEKHLPRLTVYYQLWRVWHVENGSGAIHA